MATLPGKSQADTNRIYGKLFEEAFEKFAKMSGFLVLKNELSARRIAGGKIVTLKSDLDFRIIHEGITGFFDCKCFDSDFFYAKQLDDRQVKISCDYNYFKVPSGFVVWFRKVNRVCFFQGNKINKVKLTYGDGVPLGTFSNMSLRPIFTPVTPQRLEPTTDMGS